MWRAELFAGVGTYRTVSEWVGGQQGSSSRFPNSSMCRAAFDSIRANLDAQLSDPSVSCRILCAESFVDDACIGYCLSKIGVHGRDIVKLYFVARSVEARHNMPL